jgi:hypothetical protein
MNAGAVIPVDEEVRPRGAPEDYTQASGARAFGDRSFLAYLHLLAAAVVVAGLAIRVLAATRSYFNPDEALHYQLCNQPSLFLVYKASLTNAHPPLIYFLLYCWHFLGQSEWMLRLPSVLAGAGFCWTFYQWAGLAFGRAASWIGLILVTFSPAMVALSAEVRAYALLLFCIGASLYFLERALAGKSIRHMWCFSLFLYLSILSHYSAVFFTVAAGVYVLARISHSHLPRRIVTAWAAGQAGALAIYGFLYVTHVSKIKQDEMAIWKAPFDKELFHFGRDHLLAFTGAQTSDIFQFLFENEYVSLALLFAFLAGVVILLLRKRGSERDASRSWPLGILLLAPFLAVWSAALAEVYPYIGGRHTVFLVPFLVAGVSCLLATLLGRRAWAIAVLLTLIVGATYTSGKIYEPYIKPENQRRALMIEAMNHLRQSVPRGDLILVDYQSSLPLAYYLCGPKRIMPIDTLTTGDFEFGCEGYSIVALRTWKLVHQTFPAQFEQMARSRGLKPGERVWVFQSGWAANLDTELPWFNLKYRCLTPVSFGENITLIPFVVGMDMAPALPPGSAHLTRLMRCSNT